MLSCQRSRLASIVQLNVSSFHSSSVSNGKAAKRRKVFFVFCLKVQNNLLCFQKSYLSQNSTSQDIEEVLLFEASESKKLKKLSYKTETIRSEIKTRTT